MTTYKIWTQIFVVENGVSLRASVETNHSLK